MPVMLGREPPRRKAGDDELPDHAHVHQRSEQPHPPVVIARIVHRRSIGEASEEIALTLPAIFPLPARLTHRLLLGHLRDGDVPPRVVAWYADVRIDRYV